MIFYFRSESSLIILIFNRFFIYDYIFTIILVNKIYGKIVKIYNISPLVTNQLSNIKLFTVKKHKLQDTKRKFASIVHKTCKIRFIIYFYLKYSCNNSHK